MCRLGTGIFISCGDGTICIRTRWQNWTLQEIFWFTSMFGRRTQAITTACFERVHQFLCATSTWKQVDQFNGWSASTVLQNMKTRARKHWLRHNFSARQKHHFTCLVVSSLPTWGAWSRHGVTAVSGGPSYWLVLCRTVTTRSPHDVLGPGERATIQTKAQTSRWSPFCTYVHRGQAAGHEWLKFISGCIHYAVKGLQLGLGNCGASMWLWQDSLTAQKWLS